MSSAVGRRETAIDLAAQASSPDDARSRADRLRRRRDAILDAATKEFLEKGFAGASIRNINRVAGGSIQTLYKEFGSKEELLLAVVRTPRERRLVFDGSSSGKPVDQELREIARDFLGVALRPESLAILRMMIAESAAMPKVARMIWDGGLAVFQRQLSDYFRAQAKAGRLCIPDPDLAARQFIGVTRANLDVRIMCGLDEGSPEEVERQIQLGVDLFLRGAAPAARSEP